MYLMKSRPLLPRRGIRPANMTIGIATHYSDGLVLCSDTRIVAPGGQTSSHTKQSISAFANHHLFAVSFAGSDVEAAQMLSRDIVSAAGDVEKPWQIDSAIKRVMGKWYRSYGLITPPSLQFIIVHFDVKEGRSEILKCEPPSTINRPIGLVTIGCGGDVVEHYADLLYPLPGSPARYHSLKTVLFRIAYLMRLAKERDGAYVGGNTDVAIISNVGAFTFLNREEMQRAEEFGSETNLLIHKMCSQILSNDSDSESEKIADDLSRAFVSLHARREQLDFSTLHLLDKPIWTKNSKRLAAQTSEGQR